ncbi:trypsin-like serine peptidase [Caulobacter sp. KR2-114]|uniref:trypsin-like serine peptidase n=1 Tax=Caulobacter sp. KR2-114 TaxID=3400912 RepID=UPI003C0CC7EE
MRHRFRRLAFGAVLAAAQVLAAAPALQANVFSPDGSDPRHVQARLDQPFNAIGVVDTDEAVPIEVETGHWIHERMEATAFLVSPCYVVTNFHAVFGDEPNAVSAHKRYGVTFRVGAGANGRGFTTEQHGQPVFWGDMAGEHESADWAVVRLDRCLGAESRLSWLNLGATSSIATGQALVSVAGFPEGKDEDDLWRADGCHLNARPTEVGLWSSDCAASPGSSGSPVFVMENGAPKVVGLMEGAEVDRPDIQRRYAPELANLVVDIQAVVGTPRVMAAIEADRKANGSARAT